MSFFKKGKNKAGAIQLQKMLVGHHIESIPEDSVKKVSYVMQGDGVWSVRRVALGTFINQVAEVEVPGLKSDLEEGWNLNVPKIPLSLLFTALNFFKAIHKKIKSEVFVQFFYNTDNEEYVLHCPQQTVSAASVRYENDDEHNKDNFIFVLEMHSHGSMGAFFSSTDDSDEKADRFFGVAGHISQDVPEMKFRISIGKSRHEVELFDVFQSDKYDADFPEDWLDRVKEQKVVVKKGQRNGFYKNGTAYGGGRYDYGQNLGLGHNRSWESYMQLECGEGKEIEETDVCSELEDALSHVGSLVPEKGAFIKEGDEIHLLDSEGVVVGVFEDDGSLLAEEEIFEESCDSFYDGEDID